MVLWIIQFSGILVKPVMLWFTWLKCYAMGKAAEIVDGIEIPNIGKPTIDGINVLF
jgi:hypothetical protein